MNLLGKQKLGEGSEAVVYLADYEHEQRAVKVFHHQRLEQNKKEYELL